MCDQTELPYSPGDIVWVKLGPVWWPGQVQDYEKLPEEITSNLRKKPIAVVKFFQEESFEYVKNINHIYHYNCRKKHEFIKKGLDMYRSSNTREVPTNMNLFPNDIATAEHLTGGNPNIIKDEEFAPEEKPDYSELFGTKKTTGKKYKSDSIKKEYGGWRLKHLKELPMKNGRRSLPVTTPRAITHPRFINKAFHGQSDHEVRIRYQATTPLREDDPVLLSPQKLYNCHICGFTSTRINVIVLHNKSHSAGFADTYLATSASQLKRPKLKDYSVPTAVVKSRVKSTPKRLLLGLDTPKRKKEKSPKEIKTNIVEEGSAVTSTPKKEKVVEDKSPIKKSEPGKRKYTKDKKQNIVKQKLENEAIRETLLKDWDEDDEVQEEAEIEQIKQIKEGKPVENKASDKMEQTKSGQSRYLGKRTLRLGKTYDNKEDSLKGKETSCFDFDDSDEGIRPDKTIMKFGMKIPRVLGEDKTKRKSIDVEMSEKSDATKQHEEENKKLNNLEEGSKTEEDIKLESAFESLLEETSVPVIPEVPKNLVSVNILDSTTTTSSNVQGVKKSGFSSDVKEETVSNPCSTVAVSETTNESDCKISLPDDNRCNQVSVNSLNNCEVIPSEEKPDGNVSNVSDIFSANKQDFEPVENVTDVENKIDPEDTELRVQSMCSEKIHLANEFGSQIDFKSNSESSVEYKIDSELSTVLTSNTMLEKVDASGSTEQLDASNSVKKGREIEHEISTCDRGSEIVCEQDMKENYDRISPVDDYHSIKNEHELLQKTDEISHDKDFYQSQSKAETNVLDDAEELNEIDTELVNLEQIKTETVVVSNDTVMPKTKLDLQNIVDEICIEETVENENNIEVTSDVTNVESKIVVEKDFENEVNVKTEPHDSVKKNVDTSGVDKFQDVPFDINSMPVIISEDLIQSEETKILLSSNKVQPGEVLTQSKNKSVLMISQNSGSIKEQSVSDSKVIQSVISLAGKEGQIITGKPLPGQKSLATVKTIKIPQGSSLNKLKAETLTAKSGSNQVLILKTAGGQTSKIALNKQNLHKLGIQQVIEQGGGKVLILTNPQTSGQGKLASLTAQQVLSSGSGQGKVATITTQQQVLSSGSKLIPSTRLINSKSAVLSTTSGQMVTLSKGTVQKSGVKTGQKFVIGKGNVLTTTSKNMMIDKSGLLTPIISTTKGQTFITQNVSSKGNILIPSSSTIAKSSTIMTQGITTSKGMIVTPMTNKGLISGNQKVRFVSSTAPMALPSGARLVMQNPQSKVVTIPQQKNQKVKIISNPKAQASGNTLLIQTSQGHPAILTTSTNQITTKQKLVQVSKTIPSITPQIVPRMTVAQTQPQIVTKKVVQKVRQASPNILQKTQKKTSRVQKNYPNRLISPQTVSTPAQETILLSSTGMPVIDQSNIVSSGIPQGDGTALVYVTIDKSGNYRPLNDSSLVSFEGGSQDSRTLYIDPSTTDMDNIFLTIDDAGNVVNISQPAPPTFTSESSLPSQDILAKALANTQVLQQETIIPDTVTSSICTSLDHSSAGLSSSFAEQAHYPPSLSHSVLETSLTLNQPIMTPLEVPSAVSSSNLSQITSIPSNFIHSNILARPKTQLIRPSMPLLTEDSESSHQTDPVYLLDSTNNIITPVSSGSQLSLQLSLNDNVIVSSQDGTSLIPSTYQVVTSNVLTSPIFTDPNASFKIENDATSSMDNNSVIQTPFIIHSDQNEITIPSEYVKENQSESQHITTDFLNDVESKQTEFINLGQAVTDAVNTDYLNMELDKPLLKRSVEESCDLNIKTDDSPKKIKLEER